MLGDTVTHIDGHPAELPRVRLRKIYQQEALTNVLNPKVAVTIETFWNNGKTHTTISIPFAQLLLPGFRQLRKHIFRLVKWLPTMVT
jgi:hypothetical protein